jgi:hypothetical protein
MEKEVRENIIYDLGHEIYNFLEGEEESHLHSFIAEGGGHTWGYDTINELETWSDDDNAVGFFAEIIFSGDPDEDRGNKFLSVKARVKGRSELRGGVWGIADCEVITIEPDIDEDDADYYLKTIVVHEDYFETFTSEIARLKELNQVTLESNETQTALNRLVFSGSITCLETFLKDALVHRVLTDREAFNSFFNNFKFDEGRGKVDLKEVINNENLLEEAVKENLSLILYHNLKKVAGIYWTVLGVSFPPFGDILADVIVRHDLVHRNGKTKEGEVIDIDKQAADDVIGRVEAFITAVNEEIKKLDAVPF